MRGRLETHLLEGRRVGLDPNAIERLYRAFVRHVVRHQAQVTRVDTNPVCTENIFYFLKDREGSSFYDVMQISKAQTSTSRGCQED